MPKLLIETRMNALSLVESMSEKSQKKGCLGTIKGPCADYKSPTRNSNFYSRKLWENAFSNEITKECLKDRILIGELDHPNDRLETKATEACIVMTDYDFHDDEGLLYGTFDILDTPRGRILKSLLDYGCKVGVSSRGEGDVEEVTQDDGSVVNEVDADNFEFVAFDAVVLPAVKAAKPALQESLNREKVTTLKESLINEVSSATTLAELSLIKKIVEATDMPDADSLLESVDNKSNELTKGSTGSESLMEDLEKANDEIQKLNEEVEKLKGEVTTCKSRYKKQLVLRQKTVEELSAKKKSLKDLTAEHNSSVFKSTSLSNEVDDLSKRLSESKKTIQGLKSEIRTTGSTVADYKSRISSLEESLSISQDSNRESLNKIKVLQGKIKSLTESSTSKLNESVSKSKKLQEKYNSVCRELSETKTSYIEATCRQLGIDPKKIQESVKSNTPLKEIDRLIKESYEKSERYKSLPFTQDSLIGLLDRGTVKFNGKEFTEDPELCQTYRFMEEANKL